MDLGQLHALVHLGEELAHVGVDEVTVVDLPELLVVQVLHEEVYHLLVNHEDSLCLLLAFILLGGLGVRRFPSRTIDHVDGLILEGN